MSKRSYLARIDKLKANIVGNLTVFKLADGRRYAMKKGHVLGHFADAIYGQDTEQTEVLKNAVEASDGNRLHELLKMVLN
jgi:hypothetical protein